MTTPDSRTRAPRSRPPLTPSAARGTEGRPEPQALAVAVLLAVSQMAAAQDVRDSAPASTASGLLLPKVVISATRVEADAQSVPATTTVITAQEIEEQQPGNLKGLLRHEAGVSVRSQPNQSSAVLYSTGRAGNEGINVRGLEGNQVLMQVDGVRVPNRYSLGPLSTGRGDYLESEAFKRVEILRGPSSAMHGSDGLSGAVSFVTKDPADLLAPGQSSQDSVKLGHASADRSWLLAPALARRGDGWEGMVMLNLRRGHALDNQGQDADRGYDRTLPNPQDTRSDHALAKLVLRPDGQQRIKLSMEHLTQQTDTEVLTLLGDPSYPTTTAATAREQVARDTFRLDYSWHDPRSLFHRVQLGLNWQDARTRQFGEETRSNTTSWNRRNRDSQYAETTLGLNAQAETLLGTDGQHHLVVGLDASKTQVRSVIDGAHTLNGIPVTLSSFPGAYSGFPKTGVQQLGLFVQDEIRMGPVSLFPGLRWDHFSMNPSQDDAHFQRQATYTPTSRSDQHVSPRLGAVWRLDALAQPYVQYAEGFRAPTPGLVYAAFSNLAQGYKSIENLDLRPETSQTWELGLRGRNGTVHYSLSAYHARYRDFIAENTWVGGSYTPADPAVFQSVNIARATIRGVELSGAWQFLPAWQASLSYARARGDKHSDGSSAPLNTIEPEKLSLALRHEQAQHWGSELRVVAAKRQDRPDTSGVATGKTAFVPAGYGVADLAAWWHLSRQTTLTAGVNNLFDKTYWLWSDVRGMATDTVRLDSYTQPGRSVTVSVKHTF